MSVGPVCICAILAQTQVSLGVGVGTVRYTGGSTFSAATLAPAVERVSPSLFVAGSALVSALGGGDGAGAWAGQAHVDLWAPILQGAARPSAALSAGASATTRSDGLSAASGSLLAEMFQVFGRGGAAIGIGAAGGVLERAPGVAAFRMRARGWWQPGSGAGGGGGGGGGGADLSLSIESTRYYGAWYSDILGGITIERRRVVVSGWLSARVSGAYGSSGAASAFAQYFVSPRVALEVAGGSYLRDPFQDLPRAGFVTAAVRLHHAPHGASPTAQRSPAPSAPPAPPAPLGPLIVRRGAADTVVVRFRIDARRSLAIAGDWNAWAPLPLRPLGGDVWEGVLVLPRGTYHFNLLVDGEEWVVPGGVAVVSDGMGGLVALLTVL